MLAVLAKNSTQLALTLYVITSGNLLPSVNKQIWLKW